MGAPRRNRKKYNRPKHIWDAQRISNDNALIEEYGLKNMKELWKIQTEVSRIRNNVKTILSGNGKEGMQEEIMSRLQKLGIAKEESTLENLLDLRDTAFLERRLQTIVLRKGLAKTAKQARQLIVHGFISINGRKMNKPGYLVSTAEESGIDYYKPIQIVPNAKENTESTPA
ncbi:MAG: 30S ribosomal protein S4 [Candidatus Micrarchaeia archaeon]